MWAKRCEQEEAKEEKTRLAEYKEARKSTAAGWSEDASRILEELDTLLASSLDENHGVDWEILKDFKEFSEARPNSPERPISVKVPDPGSSEYSPALGLLGLIFPSIRKRRKREAQRRYERDLEEWKEKSSSDAKAYDVAVRLHNAEVAEWERRKEVYKQGQINGNDAIEKLRTAYQQGEPEAVEEYCKLVLQALSDPLSFPKECDAEYVDSTRSLIVDHLLPNPGDIPTLKEVRYIQSRDEFREMHVSRTETVNRYDSVLYQLALRALHALYQSDGGGYLDGVTFNGWTRFNDAATGKEMTVCILSVQAIKAEFEEVNLGEVDPKACFKALKGVGSSKLHSLAAIVPIVSIQRDDARFVPSKDFADDLDEGDNLAAMDWEDFEHLVRELFEREFSEAGGEVHITRASRDAGVDAIAFDPDPIRGGKFVIQAKRYTRTVGVSAVRDLYGTVLNEGASKGILVTTADYGPDAYQFAKDKPLTLLNGGNLLHLLQKHGYRARIDLAAARSDLQVTKR